MALQGTQRAASLTARLLAFSRRQPLEPKLVALCDTGVQDKIVAREPPENWNFGYINDLWANHVP